MSHREASQPRTIGHPPHTIGQIVWSVVPGCQVWNDFFVIGDASQPFQMLVPDIRMPPDQYWPLHWHDCWIAVLLLEGSCLVGDWWMMWRRFIASRAAWFASAMFASSAHAADAPLVVAGGALDPSFTGADVYQGVPQAAKPEGKACEAAQTYVDLINAGRFEKVAELFEPDGFVLEPIRTINRGRTAIHVFYDERMRKTPPQLVAVAFVGDDKECMLEIAAKRSVRGTERYVLVSIDHFTLGNTGLQSVIAKTRELQGALNCPAYARDRSFLDTWRK